MSNQRIINRKKLERYEQLIAESLQPNVDLLLGSNSATEALMANISQIKANLIDYSRVYSKYMQEICEAETVEARKEMLASAECAFANMMSCVAQTMGMGAVMAIQGSVFESVEHLMSRYRYDDKITKAQEQLDKLMVEVLRATAMSGSEGTVLRTRLKGVRDQAIEAMGHYPMVFSILRLFNRESEVSSDVARAKEFFDLRDAMMSDTRVNEATVEELAQRLENDIEIYKDSNHLDSYFNY